MKQTFGSLYGLVTLGAVVYFVRPAATFGAVVFGFVKGALWPAVLMYKLLQFLKI